MKYPQSSKQSAATSTTAKEAKPNRCSKSNFDIGSEKSKNGSSDPSQSSTPNRPRNLLITDATQPFHFSFSRCGVNHTITIYQTPDEATWPGGALWDLGVLLSQVLVSWTPHCTNKTMIKPIRHAPQSHNQQSAASIKTKKKTNTLLSSPTITATEADGSTLPSRLLQTFPDFKWNDKRVLELGCGVGLTGLVAAALGAKLVLLTDLDVVIDQVTARNVHANTTGTVPLTQRLSMNLIGNGNSILHRTTMKSSMAHHVVAMPLCWGNAQDEARVRQVLEHFAEPTQAPRHRPKANSARSICARGQIDTMNSSNSSLPDLIIIGDVAYQHRPGAPSHFEALQSTLFQLVDDHTIVLFGTRVRMPASGELLDLFLEQLEEVVTPPLRADEIDPITFAHKKHNMTIHVLKKKTITMSQPDGHTQENE